MRTETIPITSIVLDIQNPRLIDEFDSQHSALVELFLDEQNKVYPLMKHIAENGVDPLVRVMVLPNNGDYIALEGNRRICALKVLSSPDILEGEVSDGKLKDIRKLRAEFFKTTVTEIDCAVADSREEADLWIQLRHTGSNSGVGVVDWGAEQKGRYLVRLNKPKPIAIQVLDIVHEYGSLSEAAKKSTRRVTDAIRRVVTDADFQSNLGYQIVQNTIQSKHPPKEVAKVFSKLVDDLKTGVINTTHVHSKKGRLDYIKKFGPSNRPNPKTAGSTLQAVGGSNAVVPSATTAPKKPTSQINRERLVPNDFKVTIKHRRCDKLFKEMKQLKLVPFTNTVGILLRAFLELSVDEFMDKNSIRVNKGKPTLTNKILATADYLETLPGGQGMSKGKLRPIRKFADIAHATLSNVDTLHSYVHDRHLHPTPNDLKVHWDNIESFIGRIWS